MRFSEVNLRKVCGAGTAADITRFDILGAVMLKTVDR